jgi:hypothetical protein
MTETIGLSVVGIEVTTKSLTSDESDYFSCVFHLPSSNGRAVPLYVMALTYTFQLFCLWLPENISTTLPSPILFLLKYACRFFFNSYYIL